MIILHTDLDSTLIYSNNHDIGEDKIKVDEYRTGESYITAKTRETIIRLAKDVLIVPTTTRSEKLYRRINWQGCIFKYALVSNGGILLKDGVAEAEWIRESIKIVDSVREELKDAWEFLEKDGRRKSKMEFVDDMFIVTKLADTKEVEDELKEIFADKRISVRSVKEKLYVIPQKLEKGEAVKRFRAFVLKNENIKSNLRVLAAGDGEFDIPMLLASDLGYANAALRSSMKETSNVRFLGESGIFSDEFLQEIENQLGLDN